MNPDRNRRARGRAHRAPSERLHHDDEANFFFSDRTSRHRRADQKARQLCRQVYRTLSGGLAGTSAGEGDAVLGDLAVHSVVPAPNASRLLVNVYLTTSAQVDLQLLRDRLERATPRLRAEVAGAIVRKRAPELVFNIVPAGTGEVGHPSKKLLS